MSSRPAESGNLETQLKQIGGRIREIRNILNIAAIEMASIIGISEAEYSPMKAAKKTAPLPFSISVPNISVWRSSGVRSLSIITLHPCSKTAMLNHLP